jgi:hypothetical protein
MTSLPSLDEQALEVAVTMGALLDDVDACRSAARYLRASGRAHEAGAIERMIEALGLGGVS